MNKKLTINDIANLSGVSKTTVSFILNGKDGVSDETRQKVLKIIEQHDFKPMLNSRRLYFQKSYTVAVVFDKSAPEFNNIFYFGIMNALMKQCEKYNYSLIYSQYTYNDNEIVLPNNILENDVDGLIFLKEIAQPLISKLSSLGIPFVIIDDHTNYDGVFNVKADYQIAAYTAVNYLINQGHTNIGFAGNSRLPSFYVQVLTGYQNALRDNNICINPNWLFDNITDTKSIEEYIHCNIETLPTAIFCMEDMLAINIIKYLQNSGLKLPQDVSIISIDNILLAEHITPALTTVAIDMELMGTSAIDILMKLIQNEQAKSVNISSNNLIVRQSVIKL